MGFFNMFDKKGKEATSSTSSVNLTKEKAIESLNLRKEVLSVSLRKNNAENIKARVAVVMDKSGSMRDLYTCGVVQDIVDRLLPIAIKFDDNQELDMWLFSNHAKRTKSISESEFFNYVNREVLDKAANNFWGGTNYAPVMKDVLHKYVKEEPSNIPTLVIFITDGENSDRSDAEKIIREASNHNIFWQFVGIGDENFRFLKSLDDMSGRVIDNANFFEVNNIKNISDEKLYDLLLNEYPKWEKEARTMGIIR